MRPVLVLLVDRGTAGLNNLCWSKMARPSNELRGGMESPSGGLISIGHDHRSAALTRSPPQQVMQPAGRLRFERTSSHRWEVVELSSSATPEFTAKALELSGWNRLYGLFGSSRLVAQERNCNLRPNRSGGEVGDAASNR
jgi:hypothetical protein